MGSQHGRSFKENSKCLNYKDFLQVVTGLWLLACSADTTATQSIQTASQNEFWSVALAVQTDKNSSNSHVSYTPMTNWSLNDWLDSSFIICSPCISLFSFSFNQNIADMYFFYWNNKNTKENCICSANKVFHFIYWLWKKAKLTFTKYSCPEPISQSNWRNIIRIKLKGHTTKFTCKYFMQLHSFITNPSFSN